MKVRWGIAFVLVAAAANCDAQTPMDVQPAKQVERSNTLGTCGYKPTEKEAPFFKKLDGKEQATGYRVSANPRAKGSNAQSSTLAVKVSTAFVWRPFSAIAQKGPSATGRLTAG